MRRLALRLFVPFVFVTACSDDGATADGGSDTTGGDDGDDDDDGTTPTTPGDDTMTATMTEPTGPSDTSSADGPESSGGTTSPSDGTTDTSGTTGTGSSSDDGTTDGSSSDSGSSDDESSEDGSSSDTGPDPADECVVDDDCVIVNDCCTCDSIPATDPAPDCGIPMCFVLTCQGQGIPAAEAVCEFGSCEIANVECNPAYVSCDSDPPDCGDGYYPEVDVDAGCWAGGCVPAEVCETVPDCGDCPDDETCVEYSTQLGPQFHCSPIPDACDGTVSCACMSDACESPFDSCGDGPSGISCSCPVCG